MGQSGVVVYHFIYDVADEINVDEIETRLKTATGLSYRRMTPKYVKISPAPVTMVLPPLDTFVFSAPVAAEILVHIFAVGAVTIIIKIPLPDNVQLSDLNKFSNPEISETSYSGKTMDIRAFSDAVFNREVRPRLQRYIKKGWNTSDYVEEYTSYCLTAKVDNMPAFIESNKKLLAGILREDSGPLSNDEIESALKYKVSYYDGDITITDWSSALLIDPNGDFNDALLAIEVANLQLLEFRYYDDRLSEALKIANDEFEKSSRVNSLIRGPTKLLNTVLTQRLEIQEVLETTKNEAKFFGDWWVGKIYTNITARFHLDQWNKSISEKLDDLEDIYNTVNTQVENRRTNTMDVLIVALFVLEVILLFL
jgi:hypothetical protein